MAKHNDIGQIGELLAKGFLLNKGYKIRAENYRFEKAEVDLIAEIDDCIVFVEVKTRTSHFELPEAAVTKQKRKLLTLAADNYLYEHQLDASIRFDIISIIIENSIPHFTHIEDAFFEIDA